MCTNYMANTESKQPESGDDAHAGGGVSGICCRPDIEADGTGERPQVKRKINGDCKRRSVSGKFGGITSTDLICGWRLGSGVKLTCE